MTTSDSDHKWLEQLNHSDAGVFENAITELRKRLSQHNIEDGTALILQAVQTLNDASTLSGSTRARRVKVALLTIEAPPSSLLRALGTGALKWGPSVRNEITRFLPDKFKQLTVPGQPPVSLPPPSSRRSKEGFQPFAKAIESEQAISEPSSSVVLLLGSAEEHEASKAPLKENGFTPYRVANSEELDQHLRPDLCAIVVGGTWWAAHEGQYHEHIFRRIVGYSTLIWMKVELKGLTLPDRRAKEIVQELRLVTPNAFEFKFGSAPLSSAEMGDISETRRLLESMGAVRVINANITDSQATLLNAAATRTVRDRSVSPNKTLRQARIQFLTGGKTEAHLVLVEPDNEYPVVVKIGEEKWIYEEARRFKSLVAPHFSGPAPAIYRHDGSVAIVFTLVEDADCIGKPAPTLEERVTRALNSEAYGGNAGPGDGEDTLQLVLKRTVDRLIHLNSKKCPDTGLDRYRLLSAKVTDSMEKAGIRWYLVADSVDTTSIHVLARRAAEIAARHDYAAIVHGDVHLRNVLCAGSQPNLIDWACCGPGHPCLDLARIEAAVMFRCVRPLSHEKELAEAIRRISIEGESYEALCGRYPEWMTSVGNRLAFNPCALVREGALRVLKVHGGGIDDYLAVKALVALQSLSMIELQTCVVRATLTALAGYPPFKEVRVQTQVGQPDGILSPV